MAFLKTGFVTFQNPLSTCVNVCVFETVSHGMEKKLKVFPVVVVEKGGKRLSNEDVLMIMS